VVNGHNGRDSDTCQQGVWMSAPDDGGRRRIVEETLVHRCPVLVLPVPGANTLIEVSSALMLGDSGFDPLTHRTPLDLLARRSERGRGKPRSAPWTTAPSSPAACWMSGPIGAVCCSTSFILEDRRKTASSSRSTENCAMNV
jgi:hypothetical protein